MILVYCTCPNVEVADHIARTVVEERLAACVNRIPDVRSTYRWKGSVQTEPESLLLIKTRKDRFEALKNRILTLHPYELPELIAVQVSGGFDRYLAWVADESSPD